MLENTHSSGRKLIATLNGRNEDSVTPAWWQRIETMGGPVDVFRSTAAGSEIIQNNSDTYQKAESLPLDIRK